MALSVLPVDGLINRLIQQNQRPASRSSSSSSDRTVPQDKVNISSEAKAQTDVDGAQDSAPSQLESKLLELYRSHAGSNT